ncbi:MAG: hypothetical protein QOK10_1929 [Pseudonocardiales bacterium]|jgi:hypothetical protein|nr:hypothetical protein [Pseudonocardiales bacterium]
MLEDPHDLLGSWRLDRTIDDRLNSQRGCVHGTLTLTGADDSIDWFESGVMTWSGQPLAASRRLRIVRDGAGWLVTFFDGKAFHPWSCDAWVHHQCGADLYRGRIAVLDPERIRTVWQVSGPAKEHTITTRLRRS